MANVLFRKIAGIIGAKFQLDGTNTTTPGPQLKNNLGVLEVRNAADSAFQITRGLPAIGASDYVTKSQLDTARVTIAVPIGPTATYTSTAIIPANAVVFDAIVEIDTSFSVGSTLQIGQAGTLNLLQTTTDNLMSAPATTIWGVEQATGWGAAALAVVATVAGAAVGAGTVYVTYATPAP